jgi:hypothetical protein
MSERAERSSYGEPPTVDAGALLVQGAARILELQASAARSLIAAQGRTASMFGAPDWSPLVTRNSELANLFTELFTTTAQHTLTLARQTNHTLTRVQEQMARLLEAQTGRLTYEMRASMDELMRLSAEGVHEAKQRRQRVVDEARSASDQQLAGTAPASDSGRLEGTAGSGREQAGVPAKR